MVNNQNIKPPSSENPTREERHISDGPLHDLGVVKTIANGSNSVKLVTRKCRHNVEDLGWDTEDVARLVLQLDEGHFHRSEWSRIESDRWLACDAYTICRTEYSQHARRELEFEYYIKFSIGPTGSVLLIVSCHT